MPILASSLDSWLARQAAHGREDGAIAGRSVCFLDTPVGPVRVLDSGSAKPCVVLVPDGPNVIEHYEALIGLLSQDLRVICFDMPGFGVAHRSPQS